MSDDHSPEESPVSKVLGNLVMICIPLGLIIMLGFTAVAFVKGMGGNRNAPPEVAVAGAPVPPSGGGGGGGEAAPEGVDPALWATGKKTYATCAACHGADGKGLKAGPALMAPSLIGSETLLGDPDQPILVVLKGIKKENVDYMGVMAALGVLPDDQVAGVLTYLRNFGGNSAPDVTAEMVAAAREKYADVNEPAGIPRAKISEIIEAHK